MIRRTFLINDTPLYIERFKNERMMIFKMDNGSIIECIQGHCYSLIQDDNYVLVDRIKSNDYPIRIIDKIRYYIPLNSDLNAKIDYCSKKNIRTIINVDFNNKEEADKFEVPNWFGEELLSKTKKLKMKNY